MLIVEVKQYQGEGLTALSPRVLGITEATRAQRVESVRKPKLTAQQYLSNVSSAHEQVTRYVWEEAEKRHYIISWGATAFAVRVQDSRTGNEISFLYGYESRYDFYFDGIPFSLQDAEAWRRELLATGVFRSSGRHTLRGVEVTENNKATIMQVLQRIFERMDVLLVELVA